MGELQVLGQREDPAEEREERHADRERADAEAGVAEEAEVEHRLRGAALPPHERGEQRERPCEQADDQPLPALLGRLDHGVDEDAEPGGGDDGSGNVERTGLRIAALGDEPQAQQHGDQRDGHVDEEDGGPVEPLDQQPAGQRAEPDADGGQGGPDPDRLWAAWPGPAREVPCARFRSTRSWARSSPIARRSSIVSSPIRAGARPLAERLACRTARRRAAAHLSRRSR